jgi:3-methyl-2-oxobutanoate hydroxymethyltransferase
MAKFTVNAFKESKATGHKISMLTAYDYTTAKLVDQAGVDSILVGDSLGMVMLGYKDTLKVTLDDMIHHTKAVMRGVESAFVVIDMPFMTYHTTVEDAVRNAGRAIQESGAHAVKVEGGFHVKDKIEGILKAQIPVLGHLGLTPQSVNVFGGFKVQGKDASVAQKIIQEARMLEEIGCFGIVLEAIPEKLAKVISETISIPTIGIGAGRYTDGQVLVIHDMLGMYPDFTPKFVKKYAQIGEIITQATQSFHEEIQDGTFPEAKHGFKMDDEVLEKLY